MLFPLVTDWKLFKRDKKKNILSMVFTEVISEIIKVMATFDKRHTFSYKTIKDRLYLSFYHSSNFLAQSNQNAVFVLNPVPPPLF